jgi:hypothetical protein
MQRGMAFLTDVSGQHISPTLNGHAVYVNPEGREIRLASNVGKKLPFYDAKITEVFCSHRSKFNDNKK